MFHADGKDYRTWDPTNKGEDMGKYTMDGWMRNCYLSTSVYPYIDLETQVVKASLTNYSDPAAIVYHDNADGVKFMSKPITNIQIADDGTISFDFMKDETAIRSLRSVEAPDVWYDLQGRRLDGRPQRHGLYIHNRKKVAL